MSSIIGFIRSGWAEGCAKKCLDKRCTVSGLERLTKSVVSLQATTAYTEPFRPSAIGQELQFLWDNPPGRVATPCCRPLRRLGSGITLEFPRIALQSLDGSRPHVFSP